MIALKATVVILVLLCLILMLAIWLLIANSRNLRALTISQGEDNKRLRLEVNQLKEQSLTQMTEFKTKMINAMEGKDEP